MSETKQTRCPFCNSVFNITDAQLAARGGHVRCGSCLQVFRADQNLVSGAAAAPQAAAAPRPAAPASGQPVSPPVVAKTQSSAPEPGDQPIGQRKKKKLEDESWAFNLLGEEGESVPEPEPAAKPAAPVAAAVPAPATPAAAPKSKKPMFDDELSDMLHEAWQEPETTGVKLGGPAGVDKIKESADDSWATALLSEIAEEEKKEQAKNYDMSLVNPTKAPPPKPKAAPERPAAPKPAEPKGRPDPKHQDSKAPDSNSSDDDLLNFLSSNSAPTLQQASGSLPVELHHQKHLSVNWGYYLTWSFLCALAVGMLAAQYLYFNFDKLAIDAKTRPTMVTLCETLKCKLPSPPDASLLQIRKLVIRKHPEVSGALVVNAILFNQADFMQPLPALKLVLTDKKGNIVAGRIFTPHDYLPRDFSNLRRIPPDTPLHVEIPLADPDVGFSGYKMEALL